MSEYIVKVDKAKKRHGARFLCRFKNDPYREVRSWTIIEYVEDQRSWCTDNGLWFSDINAFEVEELYRLYKNPMPQKKK